MKHTVPYYSQYKDVSDASWQSRACGVVSLAMAMDFFGVLDISIDKLIAEGVSGGAYLPGVGWRHEGLCALARVRGLSAERREWKDESRNESSLNAGIKDMQEALNGGMLVLASVARGFTGEGAPHLILLTGFEAKEDVFFYHDPAEEEHAPGKKIAAKDLAAYWRKMAIFVGPREREEALAPRQ